MADDNSSSNNSNGEKKRIVRISNVSVDTASFRDVSYSRNNASTGESGADSELLKEIIRGNANITGSIAALTEAIKAPNLANKTTTTSISNDSLIKEMQTVNQSLRALIGVTNSSNSTGGNESGPSGNGFRPGSTQAEALMFKSSQDFGKMLVESLPVFKSLDNTMKAWQFSAIAINKEETLRFKAMQLAVNTMRDRMSANITDLVGSITDLTSEMVSTRTIRQGISQRWSTTGRRALETGSTGTVGATFDLIPGMFGRDSLANTMSVIDSAISDGLIQPIGIIGKDLNEVTENLRASRMRLRDMGGAFERLDPNSANSLINELLTLERRRDVRTNLNNPVVEHRMNQQANWLQMIATNTNISALEIIKQNRALLSGIDDGVSSGTLDPAIADNLKKMGTLFNANNMSGFAEIIAGLSNAGGSYELWQSQNEDMVRGWAMQGIQGSMEQLFRGVLSGVNENDVMRMIADMQPRILHSGAAGAANMSAANRKLSGEMGLAREFDYNKTPETTMLDTFITWAQDFKTNILPWADVALVSAIGANVLALWKNTAALLKVSMIPSGLGKMFRGLGGKAGGLARGAGGAIGNIGRSLGGLLLGGGTIAAGTRAAGGLAAGAGAAGALGKGGLMAAGRAVPLLGALLGVGGAIGYGLQGDWTGAALSAGAGLASTVPGWGTAGSLGLSAALAAHEVAKVSGHGGLGGVASSIVGPAGASTITPSAVVPRNITDQNIVLEKILNTLIETKDIQEGIQRNTRIVLNPVSQRNSIMQTLFGPADNISSQSR